ncbi:MAG TPA: hypothetical protein VGP82_12320 [Ktedonobacterales bacterium]|jgi:hypothetical protein|nr:hypothetical protein [Ktedonobacterales bacterium]
MIAPVLNEQDEHIWLLVEEVERDTEGIELVHEDARIFHARSDLDATLLNERSAHETYGGCRSHGSVLMSMWGRH